MRSNSDPVSGNLVELDNVRKIQIFFLIGENKKQFEWKVALVCMFVVVHFVTRFTVVTEVSVYFLATNITRFLCLAFLLKISLCTFPLFFVLYPPHTTKYTPINKTVLGTIPHCSWEVVSARLS